MINQSFIFHRSPSPTHWPFNFSSFLFKKNIEYYLSVIYSFIGIFFHTNIPLFYMLNYELQSLCIQVYVCLFMVYGIIINKWRIECILINQRWIYFFIHLILMLSSEAVGGQQGYWEGDKAKYGLVSLLRNCNGRSVPLPFRQSRISI